MATYTELRNLFTDAALLNRLDAAIIIEAHSVLTATPALPDQQWADAALANPRREASKALLFLLAANQGSTVLQIQGATDSVIQAQVATVVPHLIAARPVPAP